MDGNGVIHDSYYLYFKYNDTEKKFSVNRSIYNKYKENEKGILIFKRNRFVDFVIK